MARLGITLEDWCIEHHCAELLNRLVNTNDKYISFGSHRKIKWKCKFNHIFETDPCKYTNPYRAYNRSIGKFSCPVCSGQLVQVRVNDLTTTRPDLAKEWDFDKNEILPTQVTKGSHKDVWWKCSLGHSWKARISARDYRNGCPYCSSTSRTSLPEQIIYYYIKKYYPDALNMYSINGVSYDIYITSKSIVIEYDGSVWHTSNDTNYKFSTAKSNDLTLYKVTGVLRDKELPNVFYLDDSDLNLTKVSNNLVLTLGVFLKQVFDIHEDFNDYKDAYNFACSQKLESRKNAVKLPDNVEFEWSLLNGYQFSYLRNDGYNKFWRCFKGHTFSRRLDVIKRGNVTCPYCTGKRSFRFFLIGSISDNYIILDMYTGDIEVATGKDIIDISIKGVNIRGLFIVNSTISIDLSYLLSYKPTSFSTDFVKFKDTGFKDCSNIPISTNLVYGLNNLFKSDMSIDEIYVHFIRRLKLC